MTPAPFPAMEPLPVMEPPGKPTAIDSVHAWRALAGRHGAAWRRPRFPVLCTSVLADAAVGFAGEDDSCLGYCLAAAGDAPRRTPGDPAGSHHLVPPVLFVLMVAVIAWIRQRPSP
jgi:hypothetical protein